MLKGYPQSPPPRPVMIFVIRSFKAPLYLFCTITLIKSCRRAWASRSSVVLYLSMRRLSTTVIVSIEITFARMIKSDCWISSCCVLRLQLQEYDLEQRNEHRIANDMLFMFRFRLDGIVTCTCRSELVYNSELSYVRHKWRITSTACCWAGIWKTSSSATEPSWKNCIWKLY